ncbi:MAG: glycoside hydrolase family 31 protein [bacterium]|nr:glycoside hydrolase family 31 protein [bacterium]
MKSNTVLFGNARFTFFSDRTFKAEYAPDGRFIDQELFVTEINNILPVEPETIIREKLLVLKTKDLTIHYRSSIPGFHKKNLKVYYSMAGRMKKWRYGMKDRKNLLGSMLHLFKFPQFTRHKDLSQGALSRNGFFSYYDKTYTYWTLKKDWAVYRHKPGYQTLFFSGYGPDYQRGLDEFSRIFGKAPLVPVWAWGFWYSRWFAYTQDEFIGLVKKYRSSGIPLDVMVVDSDWRKNVWNGYDWSPKHFPNPKKFIRQMKALGVKLTLNDHPGYNSSEPLPASDTHFPQVKKVLKKDPGKEWQCNWGDRKEVRAFLDILIKPKLKMGIDFWWIDGWGADGIYRNEEFFEKHRNADKMALGSAGYETLNPQIWLNYFYYRATAEVTKKRPLVLTRWGGIGSHRYPAWFSGDTFSTWKTLKYQVYFTATAANVQTHYWSHDLGGFLGHKISGKLFLRWTQFGAFSPVMRTHSEHGIREPWNFDKETLDIFRKYVRLRYRMIPYFYSCSMLSYLKNIPLFRAMYYSYPEEKESYKFKHQYMIGDSVLAAPVTGWRCSKKVFFPAGEWIGIENMFVTMGRSIRKLKVPVSQIPLFVKKGAIIPTGQDQRYVGEKKNNVLRFEIFPDKESSFDYYEDDGITDDYKNEKYIRIRVNVRSEDDRITVDLGKMEGSYQGLIRKRKLEIVLHILEEREISRSTVNKKPCKTGKISRIFQEIPSFLKSFQADTIYQGKALTIIFHNK